MDYFIPLPGTTAPSFASSTLVLVRPSPLLLPHLPPLTTPLSASPHTAATLAVERRPARM